ncbi:hypothetical protein M433DRAFT_145168 [Acidomyces richmondensis BFW]|nr:MAG: hypothetical protein FE78DRAFT_81808 [Acidomyces sp. 'richmondensis']KYG44159.1 hypothetical protein M433DRAFT_145168 [Acidomyces richmondensis BFW]
MEEFHTLFKRYATVTMQRNYEDAIRILDSKRRLNRPVSSASKYTLNQSATSPSPNASPITSGLRGSPNIEGMSEWLSALGHSDEDLNGLNIIHVAGTKGKGSTTSFISSFLMAHAQRTGYPLKVGLYTSPHLIHPEERIRINSCPIDRDLFAKYFFELYDHLPQLKEEYDPMKPPVDRGPRYLQLWALLAFHVFIRQNVDAAIIETHSGGEYDATNVVKNPIVTAITTLGMDHIIMLGPTIENIAWHKGGIYKTGALALSTVQLSAVTAMLKHRAEEKGETVRFIDEDDRLPKDALQLRPSVQRKNASLALAAAEAFLVRKAPNGTARLSEVDVARGVQQWSWPGRFQIVPDGVRTWFVDAAHNDMSVRLAAEWFATSAKELQRTKTSTPIRVLIFSHINELRDAISVLQSLAKALVDHDAGIQHAIFTTYSLTIEDPPQSMKQVEQFGQVWKNWHPNTSVWKEARIADALDRAKQLGEPDREVQTLITGSHHLIGPALQLLEFRGRAFTP